MLLIILSVCSYIMGTFIIYREVKNNKLINPILLIAIAVLPVLGAFFFITNNKKYKEYKRKIVFSIANDINRFINAKIFFSYIFLIIKK